MCVIAVYEKDLELNKQELQECFYGNPDGAGFMYFDNKKNKVHISKGYFTFDELWDKLQTIPTDVDRVIHFRIATSGAINTSTCHPFPVVDNYKTMGRGDVFCDVGLAHNGVMHEYTPKLGMKSKHSDTMEFVKTMVYPLGEAIWNTQVQELLEEHVSGNKFAIVGKDKLVVLGDFQQSKDSHALYSNGSYKKPKYASYYDYMSYTPTHDFATIDDIGCKCIEDEYGFPYYPVEIFTGKLTESSEMEYVNEMFNLADDYGVDIYDYIPKGYSLVFYVSDPTVLVGEKINNKTIMDGDYQYSIEG